MTKNIKSNFILSVLFYVDRARRSHTEYITTLKKLFWQDTALKLIRLILNRNLPTHSF